MTDLVQVVVDVPIWSLDRPLTYRVPPALAGAAVLGAVVRVPLRGRRVRGWVVGPSPGRPPEDLQDIAGVSGSGPVFDAALLAAARAIARRTVHPLSSFLRLLTPPQMGRRMASAAPGSPLGAHGAPLRPTAQGQKILRRLAPREDPVALYGTAIEAVVAAGRGALVVLPEIREGSLVVEGLAARFGRQAAVVHSGQTPATRSRALWAGARGRCPVILGGRGAVLAPGFDLGLVIVHDEDDWTLKAEGAPYFDARDVAEARAEAGGADLWLASVTPSLRSWHRASRPGWERRVADGARTGWPRVSLVAPERSPLAERSVAAILATRRAGGRTLVFVPRREATPAGPGPAEVAAYVARVLPDARVGRAEPGEGLADALASDVVVATEGALAEIEHPPVATAIVLGVDSLVHHPKGQAAEDAFAVLWRLACLVARSDTASRTLVLEAASPGHHVVRAVGRGDYDFFARAELEARREAASPPFVTLARVRGVTISDATRDRLGGLPGTEVFGPVEGRQGPEVLLKIEDPQAVVDELRTIVAASSKGREAERLVVEMAPRDW